jgi:hypothetical protein|tara:strand:+ start:157 stop:381 length:225 start_codon:yes stop_codon:yes gene_type:complete
MIITRNQLRQIIKENLLYESLYKLVKKHAVGGGGRTMNDMIDDALADPYFEELGISKDELVDAFDDYFDDLSGY